MRCIEIPIYGGKVYVAVIHRKKWKSESRAAWQKVFGKKLNRTTKDRLKDGDAAQHWRRDGAFLLLFNHDRTAIQYVGHEVFHLTHRILEWCGDSFEAHHHEPAAYLNGYLLRIVTEEIRRHEKRLP